MYGNNSYVFGIAPCSSRAHLSFLCVMWWHTTGDSTPLSLTSVPSGGTLWVPTPCHLLFFSLLLIHPPSSSYFHGYRALPATDKSHVLLSRIHRRPCRFALHIQSGCQMKKNVYIYTSSHPSFAPKPPLKLIKQLAHTPPPPPPSLLAIIP